MTFFQPILDLKQKWCGPAAVAILTGVPYSRVEDMIRRGRGKGWRTKPIKGTYIHELVKVLKRLDCKVERVDVYENTAPKFADDVRHAGAYLFRVPGHIMVACGGIIADNSNPEGVPAEVYGRARRVNQAYRVVAPALPKFTLDDALVTSAARAPKPKMDVKLRRVNKVVASIKRWERKEKLAKTKLKKLRRQLAYYKGKGLVP